MKRRTLEERCNKRHASEFMTPAFIVRAEFKRLARQVRKLNTYDDRPLPSRWIRQIDVLDLIREAGK